MDASNTTSTSTSTHSGAPGIGYFYTLPEVCKTFRISRTALYDLMQAGEFPAPIKLGSKTRRALWPADTLARWLDERRRAHEARLAAAKLAVKSATTSTLPK